VFFLFISFIISLYLFNIICQIALLVFCFNGKITRFSQYIYIYIYIYIYVLTTGTKNTRNRLTRLILHANPSILGWTLGFSSRQVLSASPHGRCSRLLLTAGAFGFSSRQVLSASPHGRCSRLPLTTGALGFSSRQVGVPASRSDAKVRNGLIFIR